MARDRRCRFPRDQPRPAGVLSFPVPCVSILYRERPVSHSPRLGTEIRRIPDACGLDVIPSYCQSPCGMPAAVVTQCLSRDSVNRHEPHHLFCGDAPIAARFENVALWHLLCTHGRHDEK
jgi:hypothetical protein